MIAFEKQVRSVSFKVRAVSRPGEQRLQEPREDVCAPSSVWGVVRAGRRPTHLARHRWTSDAVGILATRMCRTPMRRVSATARRRSTGHAAKCAAQWSRKRWCEKTGGRSWAPDLCAPPPPKSWADTFQAQSVSDPGDTVWQRHLGEARRDCQTGCVCLDAGILGGTCRFTGKYLAICC